LIETTVDRFVGSAAEAGSSSFSQPEPISADKAKKIKINLFILLYAKKFILSLITSTSAIHQHGDHIAKTL
jgi:hypothetical protein